MSMSLFSSPSPHFPSLSPPKPHLTHKPFLPLSLKKTHFLFLISPKSIDATSSSSAVIIDQEKDIKDEGSNGVPLNSNGSSPAVVAGAPATEGLRKFQDDRWVGGTWDLNQFEKEGKVHWDSVIDAEVRRRKWLEENPESSSNEDPVLFDTSIIPWWAWMKRFHLPEAERLNGSCCNGWFLYGLLCG